MADLKASANALIAEVTSEVSKALLAKTAPIVRTILEAAGELAAALAGAAPAKPGRKPGRPAGKAAKASRVARPRGKALKRNPRGTMRAAIISVMQSAGKALKLTQVRDAIQDLSAFQERDSKVLYTQVIQAIKRIPEIRKTAGGAYRLSSGSSVADGPVKKGRRKAKR